MILLPLLFFVLIPLLHPLLLFLPLCLFRKLLPLAFVALFFLRELLRKESNVKDIFLVAEDLLFEIFSKHCTTLVVLCHNTILYSSIDTILYSSICCHTIRYSTHISCTYCKKAVDYFFFSKQKCKLLLVILLFIELFYDRVLALMFARSLYFFGFIMYTSVVCCGVAWNGLDALDEHSE